MSISTDIKKKINSISKIPHHNGYVNCWKENLLSGLDVKAVESDLKSGSGQELDKKFRAIYSSSALCVNNFGILKDAKLCSNFELLGQTGFAPVVFEKKLPTGLKGTPPNLDAYFENDKCIICIESKYTEHFKKKKAKFKPKYEDNKDKILSYLPESFWKVKERYMNYYGYLDIAQLLKHTIGLINNRNGKQPHLLYIYWQPENQDSIDVCNEHQKELEEFQEQMKTLTEISFHAMSYSEFWMKYENDKNIGEHIKIVIKRYKI
ncbi:hypothetical protein D9V86_09395 [Bacteroidetes/Chlorobi group bacterium ChocPot_Mid]|nr:MAG: hypothetical protein D9V86_09395 [Bacteroidetes/Chlorobi group bacterium ChocPot_Mid]